MPVQDTTQEQWFAFMLFRPLARDKLLFIIICIFLCKIPILTEPLNAYGLAV